jgi:hypothetical protein
MRQRRITAAGAGRRLLSASDLRCACILRQDKTLLKAGGVGDRGSKQRAVHARFEGVKDVVDSATPSLASTLPESSECEHADANALCRVRSYNYLAGYSRSRAAFWGTQLQRSVECTSDIPPL